MESQEMRLLIAFDAVERDDTARLQSALDGGVSSDARDANDQHLLYRAAAAGAISCIDTLLDAGAHVNLWTVSSRGDLRRTALNEAIWNEKFASAALLIERGANPKIPAENNDSAGHLLLRRLETFCRTQAPQKYVMEDSLLKTGLALLDTLLKHGLPANQPGSSGETMLAVALNLPSAYTQCLLEHGSDTGLSLPGTRVKHKLWDRSTLDVLRQLVSHGANLNTVDQLGRSMLSYACDPETVDEMIRLGADINHTDDLGQNTFHSFLTRGFGTGKYLPMLLRLIEHGTDLDHVDDHVGESARTLLERQDEDVSSLLKAGVVARDARLAIRQVAANLGPKFTPPMRQ